MNKSNDLCSIENNQYYFHKKHKKVLIVNNIVGMRNHFNWINEEVCSDYSITNDPLFLKASFLFFEYESMFHEELVLIGKNYKLIKLLYE